MSDLEVGGGCQTWRWVVDVRAGGGCQSWR